MILDVVADYFGWVPPHVDEWGVVVLCGQVGGAVFYVDVDDSGFLRASCVIDGGVLMYDNSFVVHVSDPDMFKGLGVWMGSFSG